MYTSISKILHSLTSKELIQYTNDEGRPESEINLDDSSDVIVIRVNELIGNADAWINSFFRGKYVVPVSSTAELEELSTSETIYRLIKRRHAKNMPEGIVKEHNENFKYLMEVQKGNIVPEGLKTLSGNDKADVMIKTNKTSMSKIFTDDYLKDF